jgi:hypothetical protein
MTTFLLETLSFVDRIILLLLICELNMRFRIIGDVANLKNFSPLMGNSDFAYSS